MIGSGWMARGVEETARDVVGPFPFAMTEDKGRHQGWGNKVIGSGWMGAWRGRQEADIPGKQSERANKRTMQKYGGASVVL